MFGDKSFCAAALVGHVLLTALGGMSEAAPKEAEAVPSLRLVYAAEPGSVVAKIADLFTRQVERRCAARVVVQGETPFTVELAIEPGLGAEGYQIADGSPGTLRIVGHDERGLLYGVGKFLRTSRYDQGGFTPGAWRGAARPQKPLRGIYCATHFHNFYHDAPVDEVERYIEELGLWGYNTVLVWYDMSLFRGFDDPQAVHYRQRLRAILKSAQAIGLDVAWGDVANAGYADSPAELRADGRGSRGASFACDICPSTPGGRQYILANAERLFETFADLKPKYYLLAPYDNGGCGCEQCRPWGSNGFLRMAEPLAESARRSLPGIQVILATMQCSPEEWRALTKTLTPRPAWVDYLMGEYLSDNSNPLLSIGVPEGLPTVGFPEISMHQTFPWGGFGATPLPRLVQQQWDALQPHSAGGFPYSEGIFEDLTKAVYAQFYWSNRPAEETVREYVAFEYSPEVVDEVLPVLATLEQNHHWRWWPEIFQGVAEATWVPSRGAKPQADPGAEEAYAAVQRIDQKLSPPVRKSWRWRHLYLRTLLDAELKANGGRPNDRCQEAFAELIELYHAQHADYAVRPPLDRAWHP